MTPEEAAKASADAIVNLPAGFMFDAATYARGAELGYEGIDLYTAGRGGALGDVDGLVVAAAFVVFEPSAVVDSWERALKVADPLASAATFAACLRSWALDHLASDVDYDRLAELAGRVLSAAPVAGVPLFAAWSVLSEPPEPAALALFRLNLLRELRGGWHGAAVLSAGLSPLQAVMVRTPNFAGLFGWPEPHPDGAPHKEAWAHAEAATDAAMARVLGCLDDSELDAFVELAAAAKAAAR